jgi:hypothetical protein
VVLVRMVVAPFSSHAICAGKRDLCIPTAKRSVSGLA